MGKGIPCRCAGDCGRGRCASGDPEEGDGTEPWAWVGRDTAARACRAGETGRAGKRAGWAGARVEAMRGTGPADWVERWAGVGFGFLLFYFLCFSKSNTTPTI